MENFIFCAVDMSCGGNKNSFSGEISCEYGNKSTKQGRDLGVFLCLTVTWTRAKEIAMGCKMLNDQ